MTARGTDAAGERSDELDFFGYTSSWTASSRALRRGSATPRFSPARFSCSTSAQRFGDPVYSWSWPLVFVGHLMVALCFAERAANHPVAGSIYHGVKRMGYGDGSGKYDFAATP